MLGRRQIIFNIVCLSKAGGRITCRLLHAAVLNKRDHTPPGLWAEAQKVQIHYPLWRTDNKLCFADAGSTSCLHMTIMCHYKVYVAGPHSC